MVGTPGKAVARTRSSVFSAWPASKRGSIAMQPPLSTVRLSTETLAKTWNSGSTPTITSRSPARGSSALTWRALAVMFWWVSIAPLGVPVVPPVYCSSARSVSGSTATGAGGR